jgi:hypothetical protein
MPSSRAKEAVRGAREEELARGGAPGGARGAPGGARLGLIEPPAPSPPLVLPPRPHVAALASSKRAAAAI